MEGRGRGSVSYRYQDLTGYFRNVFECKTDSSAILMLLLLNQMPYIFVQGKAIVDVCRDGILDED